MRVTLFRHAERGALPHGDPSLSDLGRQQAQNLVELVQSGTLHKPEVLFSSPKKRAQQTFQPLAQELQISLSIRDELAEKTALENSQIFFDRVREFIKFLGQQKQNVFIVTHLDWLQEAMLSIPADTDLDQLTYRAWTSAQYMEFEIKNDLWHVLNFDKVK